MLKPPKIVITNIDEDPAVRRDGRRKKIAEICALIILLLVNFGLCLSRLCLVFGMLSGIVTSLITIMQYIFFVKTSFASHFGPKQKRPHYTEQLSLVNSLRWSIGSLAKCSTCVQSELHGGLSNKVTATSA